MCRDLTGPRSTERRRRCDRRVHIIFSGCPQVPCVAICQDHAWRNAAVTVCAGSNVFQVVVRRSMCGDRQGQRLTERRCDRGRRPGFSADGCAHVHAAVCWTAGKEQRGRRRHCSCAFPGAQATSRHSRSAVCVLVFRRPHRVCLPAVCRVGGVFRSPPVDSKVRPYVRQRRRACSFGGTSGRIPSGAVGLVPACCAGWNRGGATPLRIFYFPVVLRCICWLARSPRAMGRKTFVCLGVNCFVERYVVADGHAASNAPELFRQPKLSGARPG